MAVPQPLRLAGDYGNQPPPPWHVRIRWWSLTYWLIAINVALYLVDLLTRGWISDWGEFSADQAFHHLQLWRLITCSFLHASPEHLGFNMIALWAFGPFVETVLRPRRYLAFYLFCGLGGILGYLLLWRLQFLDVTSQTALVGASANIFGVMIAGARLSPNRIIRLMWPPVQLRLITLGWILIGLAVLKIASRSDNAGGEAAHLGGAFVGYVLIKNLHVFSKIGLAPRQKFWKPGDPKSNFFRPDA
jgi:membrane associated rhomboid family serine protease